MTQYELESRWITTEGIPGVSYRYGDLVRIKSGECSGETAQIIALLSLEPEPSYGMTLPPDEKFVVLSQSELESTGENTGSTLYLVPLEAQ